MELHELAGVPEFVGITVLDTVGLVIPGADSALLERLAPHNPRGYHALGLISSRTGAAGQITAVDDAIKNTNTELLTFGTYHTDLFCSDFLIDWRFFCADKNAPPKNKFNKAKNARNIPAHKTAQKCLLRCRISTPARFAAG